MWLSSGDSCQPKGQKRSSCLRLIQLGVDSSDGAHAPKKTYDLDLTRRGLNSFYPAVTMDAARDLIVSYSVSSDTVYATPEEVSLVAGASFANVVAENWSVTQPDGPISCSFCGKPNRFGDYSGAAPDPVNPEDVWVAAEWGSANPTDGRWATSIGHFTFGTPIPT